MMFKNRVFVSFDEPCAYHCKHCYTYGIERKKYRTIEEIVSDIKGQCFDIIYVSQKNDNFSNPDRGMDLVERLFEKYNKDIFIITRSVFNDSELRRLENIKQQMAVSKKRLFIAISMNSLESFDVSENAGLVPSPEDRIKFIKKLSSHSFSPILMLRPIFPDRIIPIAESFRIIEQCSPYVSCIISSGLGVNDDILGRLKIEKEEFSYVQGEEYLQGAISCEISFVDVAKELEMISSKCAEKGVRFFEHSMPALNYLNL